MAFDSITIILIIAKLKTEYNLDDFWLNLISSYLTGRTHSVKIGDCHSTKLIMHSGVPQGSILGPILFTLYINNLPKSVDNCISFLYADDAKFIIHKDNRNVNPQTVLDSISTWCTQNNLKINSEKSSILNFGSHKKTTDNIFATINNQQIPVVDSQKDLGVIITSNLNWSDNVNYRIAKANKIFLFMKRSCLQNTSIQFRKFIWLTYIRPAVSYGSQCYYPNISDLLLLENFQKRVTR